MHDVVVRNGLVVDGTGAPAAHGDVAIDGETIVEVTAPGRAGRARHEIDADGRLVTPGWVDVHTHYDGQATWDPELSPSGWHGVTTVVMGNCGVGFAPAAPERRDWLIQLMEGVEDIPGTALAEGMSWNWETFPEYLDELDRMPRVMDVAALVPHGAVRAYVMGERGASNEEATAADVAAMAEIVAEAIRAGAAGFSTTRTVLHRAKDGQLAAGTTASPDELLGIGDAMGAAGGGVFELASDMVVPADEFAWMAELSRRSGRTVTFNCLQSDVWPEQWRELLQLADEANATGAHVVPQVAGRPACLLFGLESSVHPFIANPTYRRLADLPLAERVARMRTPEVRAAILAEQIDVGDFGNHLLRSFHKLFPLGDPPDYEPAPSSSVAAIADREGRPAAEVAYDLLLQRDGHELLYFPLLGYSHGDFGALQSMLEHPGTVLGLGDGGAHCGLLCDASLPSYMLTHWVRDRDRGERLGLERVVAMQTSETAALYGYGDRGVLAPGFRADVNVVDLDGLRLAPPEMVHDLPAGGRRLIQRANGYGATLCAGVPVRLDDEATGERPGHLLRGTRPVPTGR
ncbi:MAG: N-acyl-D-amino-acid deacylase family protein [Microthrixaceae bacterium]|jgi:N-acyl-D-aspartate/D-glutamate deacylase